MRRIFTSPRLENVERVAALLQAEGVEARITNGRSYKGGTRSRFTYRDDARNEPDPAVWIVRPDDQTKARELMRAAGLLDSGRSPTSYMSMTDLHAPREADPAKRRIFLIKMALLIGIMVAASVGLFAWRKPAPTAAPMPAAAVPATASLPQAASETIVDTPDDTYMVEVPSALAAMLFDAELRAHGNADICLSVDGADAPEKVLGQLRAADGARIRPRSTCASAAEAGRVVSVEVSEYRTDGSGTGTVQVEIADRDQDGKPRVQTRTLEVQRDGLQWGVKRVVL
jgi:hypothetical protein